MCRACQEHLTELQEQTLEAHTGTTPDERLQRFGHYRDECGENLVYGFRVARELVWHMLIDDGVPERGHRANLLNVDFHFVGVAYGAHASEGTACVLMFADRFEAKQVDSIERIKNVVETSSLQAIVSVETRKEKKELVQNSWDKLMEQVKPSHLAVPVSALDGMQRLHRGKSSVQSRREVPRHVVESLVPRQGIDPTVVRAFVDRVRTTHETVVQESEIAAICHHAQLIISPAEIARMFDDVIERRPSKARQERCIDWMEVFTSMRPRKRWTQVVDVRVEDIEGRYELVMEEETLFRACGEVASGLGEEPPATLGEVRAFLRSLTNEVQAGRGQGRQQNPTVQRLLKTPEDDPEELAVRPRIFQSIVVASRRKLWAFEVRPFQHTWLRLFRAVSLNPLMSARQGKTNVASRPCELPRDKDINVARSEKMHYSGLPPHLERMQIREVPETLWRTHTEGAPRQAPVSCGGAVQPWEDRRQQMETLVNDCLRSDAPQAEMAYSFDARQKFSGIIAKQHRASDEQAFLASERHAESLRASSARPKDARCSRCRGLSRAQNGGAQSRCRGAGASVLVALGGVRGHAHGTSNGGDSQNGIWHSQPTVQWDGAHIDQTRLPPQKEEIKLSTMTKEERAKQFNIHVTRAGGDTFASKCAAVAFFGEPQKWQTRSLYEARADNPERHGKCGRQIFDTYLRSLPVDNPHGISVL